MEMHLVRARVSGIVDLSPHLRRITLTSPGFADFPYAGPDQRVKLVLADDPADLPHGDGPYGFARFTAFMLKASIRGPHIRTYTVRRHRPEAHEIDIDFALHHPGGPATEWAAKASVGAEACIYGPASEFVDAHPAWQMFIGDETALPAIAAILESLPADARGRVLIEVPDAADALALTSPTGVTVDYLVRDQGTGLLDAVIDAAIPDEPVRFWVAGEAHTTTSIRRHLVRDRGIDKKGVTFCGYWKSARPQ